MKKSIIFLAILFCTASFAASAQDKVIGEKSKEKVIGEKIIGEKNVANQQVSKAAASPRWPTRGSTAATRGRSTSRRTGCRSSTSPR